MEEQKLTVQEATELLLMSQSSVYSWIDKGKLKTIDSPTGKLIVISGKEIETIRELNLKSRRNRVSKQNLTNSDNFQNFTIIDAEYSRNDEVLLSSSSSDSNSDSNSDLHYDNSAPSAHQNSQNPRPASQTPAQSTDVNLYLVKQLEKYALDAGQFKQLEIIHRQEKDDLEHWKTEYYALKSEHVTALARLEETENRLEETENRLEETENKLEELKNQLPPEAQLQNSQNPRPASQTQSQNPQESGISAALKKFFGYP